MLSHRLRNTILATLTLGAGFASAAPALADEVSGTLLAHDRVAHRIVLENRESYEYDPEKTVVPDELLAGDQVRIVYRGSEDGVDSVSEIERLEPGAGATDGDG